MQKNRMIFGFEPGVFSSIPASRGSMSFGRRKQRKPAHRHLGAAGVGRRIGAENWDSETKQ
jgi:hypothetical protein